MTDGGQAGTAGVAWRLTELAQALRRGQGTDDTLDLVVRSAVDLVPGAQDASISLVLERRRIEPRYSTGSLPDQVNAIQTETEEGPCLHAVAEQQPVHVLDMTRDSRLPLFTRRASRTGVRSMLSLPLSVEQDNLGSLALFSRSPDAFDEDSVHIGTLFAAHAALAWSGAREQQQLRAGLDSRDVIGQAKGILMERYDLDGDAAFSLLVRTSRTANRKLRDVCDELVLTRKLTGQPRNRPAHPLG